MENNELFNTKMSRCRYFMPGLKGHYCKKKEIEPSCEYCDNCTDFNSLFIEYPIQVNNIETEDFENSHDLYQNKIGSLVEIRPCGEEYDKKTYVGILLGELPMTANVSFNNKTGTIKVSPHFNPAIFVPELKRIIFGASSWWRVIDNADELKGISDDDIANTWYVQMMKNMCATNGEGAKNLQERGLLKP